MLKHALSVACTCLGHTLFVYGPSIGTLLIGIGKALE
jgi:hypothetical protein